MTIPSPLPDVALSLDVAEGNKDDYFSCILFLFFSSIELRVVNFEFRVEDFELKVNLNKDTVAREALKLHLKASVTHSRFWPR